MGPETFPGPLTRVAVPCNLVQVIGLEDIGELLAYVIGAKWWPSLSNTVQDHFAIKPGGGLSLE